MKTALLAAAFLLVAAPSWAQDAQTQVNEGSDTPTRFSVLLTFGDEKCPEAQGDEIVVCAPAPEGDRYRIPKKLREKPAEDIAGGSWTSAVESLDDASRMTMPNSCSAVGSNGFTGCTQAMLRQWFAEKRSKSAATRKD